jgi:uncharacterized lipoprotein YmbA
MSPALYILIDAVLLNSECTVGNKKNSYFSLTNMASKKCSGSKDTQYPIVKIRQVYLPIKYGIWI